MSPVREDNPNYPGIDGLWFKVTDKDGNDVDLTPYSPKPVKMKNGEPAQIVVDDNDSHLGWYPTTSLKSGRGTVKQFKSVLLKLEMGMKSSTNYTLNDDNSSGPLDDDATMDYDSVGLTSSEPLTVEETPPDKTDNDKDKDDDGNGPTGDDNADDGDKDKGPSNDDDKVDGDDNNGGKGDNDDKGTADDDKGTGDDDKGTTEDDDKGTGDDDKGTTEDDDKGTTEDDDKGKTEDDDKGTTEDDDKGTTENDDKSDNDKPADDDDKGTTDDGQGTTGDDNDDDKGTRDDDKGSEDDNDDNNSDDGHRKPKSKRDWYPGSPNVKGFWFEVVDINGNSLDLSSDFQRWDKAGSQTDVAWLPIKRTYTALQLKKRVLKKLGLKVGKYSVYNDDNDSVPYDDSGDVDLDNNGLKKKRPLVFKESQDDDSDEGNGSDNSSSSSDDEMPPPDNPAYISNTSQDYNNNDPYRFFTKRIQCMSSADWSRYEGSIQNTYQGEILWTDGNLSYGVANMMAYMAVRRVPNTPTGSVVAVGRAANEPAYFVYLG